MGGLIELDMDNSSQAKVEGLGKSMEGCGRKRHKTIACAQMGAHVHRAALESVGMLPGAVVSGEHQGGL